MNPTILARLVRALLVAVAVAAVLAAVVLGVGALLSQELGVLLPFVAVAGCAVALAVGLPRVDRLVTRITHHRQTTPYAALADAAARIRAGSLDEALPGLAQVIVDGTSAAQGTVWLAVGDRLVSAARYPADPVSGPETVENIAVLLSRDDTGHVVPVLDGTLLRAALAIDKPGTSITPADRQLMRDVANGAALLLRGVAQNAELAERVRRADELAAQLQGSRQRLAKARETERRRLVLELSHATTDRLAALHADIAEAGTTILPCAEDGEAAAQALARARIGLDELLDRFRVIARGVYPAVLRDQGPASALDEVAADLPRPVRLTGGLGGRLAWEIESGLYYVAAATLHELAGQPADSDLVLHLERSDGRVGLLVDDPDAPVGPDRLRQALADDAERLVALGGVVELTGGPPVAAGAPAPVRLQAWLPDRLEPLVDVGAGDGLTRGTR